jgi:hypothetical protein
MTSEDQKSTTLPGTTPTPRAKALGRFFELPLLGVLPTVFGPGISLELETWNRP